MINDNLVTEEPAPTAAAPNGTPKSADKPSATNELTSRPPRTKRPNYAQIHAKPLPFEVYPLPAFVPHNPLSLVRIAIALLSSSIWPPKSLTVVHKAYFSAETQSVHVTDPASVRALWEQGFWGAGSLSRSEPRWLDQEKGKRGITAALTSEEFTRQRREERRQFKLERARLERETIEQQRLKESKEPSDEAVTATHGTNRLSEDVATDVTFASTDPVIDTEKPGLSGSAGIQAQSLETEVAPEVLEEEIEDQEHLQLTFEEAFFLSYGLGALNVVNTDATDIFKNEHPVNCSQLLRLFCAYSTFPLAHNVEQPVLKIDSSMKRPVHDLSISQPITTDNAFLLKYVVFHHFRSLGWVVRPGIKFAVDYLLYNRGPVFSHAEFAIMIIPSYSHPYWSETPERKAECKEKEGRDWWWLHRVNRVQSQVHKTLVLVYVDVPPPWTDDAVGLGTGMEVDVGKVLKQYKVREFVLRRWTPNRNRD
jgi:tRNA-splicing endonuclease subunit Sen2